MRLRLNPFAPTGVSIVEPKVIAEGPTSTTTVETGGSSTFNQWILTFPKKGPTSYSTGGIVFDLRKTFSSLNIFDPVLETEGTIVAHDYEIEINVPTAGQATMKIIRDRYDQLTSTGSVTDQPSGVALRTTSGGVSVSEALHTHSRDHNHIGFNSTANTFGGGQVLLDVLGPNLEIHTHELDLVNNTGISGAGTSHNHTDNSLYQHQHTPSFTATTFSNVEIANGSNLSGTIWTIFASGVRL